MLFSRSSAFVMVMLAAPWSGTSIMSMVPRCAQVAPAAVWQQRLPASVPDWQVCDGEPAHDAPAAHEATSQIWPIAPATVHCFTTALKPLNMRLFDHVGCWFGLLISAMLRKCTRKRP